MPVRNGDLPLTMSLEFNKYGIRDKTIYSGINK